MCKSEGGAGAQAIYVLTSGNLTSFGYEVLCPYIDGPGITCSMGLMCLSKFIWYRDNIDSFSLVGDAGEIHVQVFKDGSVKVDMGSPIIEPPLVPTAGVLGTCVVIGIPYDIVFAGGKGPTDLGVTLLKAGIKVDQLKRMTMPQTSVLILHAEAYVYGDIQSRSEVKMDMMGFDIVDSLGEAACALVVAAVLDGRVDRESCVVRFTRGGSVKIEWAEDSHVYMTGMAEFIFQGSWPLQ